MEFQKQQLDINCLVLEQWSLNLGPKPLLTKAEEEVLVNYIIHAQKRAHPVTNGNVMNAVKCILEDEEGKGIQRQIPQSFYGNMTKQKWWKLHYTPSKHNFSLTTNAYVSKEIH